MYGGARLKVWQVVVLGVLWVILGIVLDQAIDWDAHRVVGHYSYRGRGASELFHALKLWLTRRPVVTSLAAFASCSRSEPAVTPLAAFAAMPSVSLTLQLTPGRCDTSAGHGRRVVRPLAILRRR